MKHYGLNDGLPNVQVFDLHGGKDQLLYLGTSNGLYRFNGIKFERLAFEKQPASISYITEYEGRIWCKDFSNRLFYLDKEILKEFLPARKFLSQGTLVNYHLQDSVVYMASRDKFTSYSLKSKQYKTHELKNTGVSTIYDFKVTQSYIAIAGSGEVVIYKLPGLEKVMSIHQPLMNMELTANDGLFYLAYRGVFDYDAFEINPSTKTVTTLGKLPAEVHSNFLRVWQNKLYWCTNNGAYSYDRSSKSFELSFLPNKRISDIITDKRGNHWISTLDHSLYLLPHELNLKIVGALPNEERITVLAPDQQGNLLAGTNVGSILTFDPSGNQIGSIPGKVYDQIEFMEVDPEGGLIYFTHGIKNLKGNWIHEQFMGKSLARDKLGNYVYAAGDLVSMSGEKLYTFPIAQKKQKVLRYGRHELILRNQRARKVLYYPYKGLYLVAYTDKLMAYSILGDEFEVTQSNGQSLIVNEILVASDQSVWLGTMNDGIWIYNGTTGDVKQLKAEGLSGKYIKKMVGNQEGTIWVATDRGLDCYRSDSKKFEPYLEIFGFAETYIYDLMISNDFLYLATDNGLIKMPVNPSIELRTPSLQIMRIFVNGKEWGPENTTLPSSFKKLRIDFRPIHFQSEGKVYAQYRFSNSDSNWSTLPAGVQSLTIFGLPAGDHTIELRLLANTLHSQPFIWDFNVAYPVWQRWWFIAFTAIALVGFTVLLSRNYNKRKLKGRLMEQALASSKLTAMKAQMNPHFLYNVLNSIQGLIYANKKEEAADYLSKFSDLMRLTLNFSDKQWHEISEEISALDLYLQLEASRFSNDISFEVRIDEATRRENPLVPSMLIQPYVENAIKHGLLHKIGPKRLTIDFSMHPAINRIIISVEDNGIGRKQSATMAEKRSKTHRSFATQSLQSRLQVLNQMLSDPVEVEIIDKKNDYQQPTGTLVIIRLPFKHE